MRRYLLTLSCLLTICSTAISQKWISVDETPQGKAVTMKVLQSDEHGYQMKVEIHGLYDNVVHKNESSYHMLSIGENGHLSSNGSPALPYISQLLAIPPEASMSVSVIEEQWVNIEMGMIYPAQNKYGDARNDDFYINEAVYKKDFTPSIVSIGKERVWHGIRHAGVVVCPFKYYPVENRLSVLSRFTLRVEFSPMMPTFLQKVDRDFGLFNNTVFERRKRSSSLRSANSDNYNYLIIHPTSNSTNDLVFKEKLKHFKIWKALKGYKTKVASTDTIGNTAADIKSFIDLERAHGIKYVLFIADANDVPLADVASYNGNETIYSDYWYGCPNGSDEADIPVGRFSISCANDFRNMVNKTIKYESTYNSNNNALLIAHGMDAPASYVGCSEAIEFGNYNEQISFGKAYGTSPANHGNNATNEYVINQINSGYNIVNYRGHAGVDYWGYGQWGIPTWNEAGECFESSQIDNMDSTTCSVFFCVACNTGNIDSSGDCMLETFTRSDHGAVSFIGATRSTQTSANSEYNKLLFQKLLNNSIYHLGEINIEAHIQNINTYGIGTGNEFMASDNAYAYICGGDPSLEVWTSNPLTIGNVGVTSSNGYMTVTTGLTGNYYIAISSLDGERLDSISCSGSTCTFPIPEDRFFFAINKHNYFPRIVYFDRESNYIQNVNFTYDAYYEGTPLEIGDGVTPDVPDGDVIVKSGHKLIIKNGNGGVYIDAGFECETGGILEIK